MIAKFIQFLFLFGILCMACSCGKDDHFSDLNGNKVVISKTTRDTLVHILVEGAKVPVHLSIPSYCAESDCPAVVVLHGSGGMWKDDNPDAGIPGRQFREWSQILTENGILCAMVDSFTPRGCIEADGTCDEPPKKFDISPQFVRSGDAFATLSTLRNLKYKDGSRVVRPNDVGLLGFSDGGTALAATMYDQNTTPDNWEWSQSYNGKDYNTSTGVKPPPSQPAKGGFTAAINYYGGSSAHGYFGSNPCSEDAFSKNIFEVDDPVLYIIPEDDSLSENTLCMVSILQEKGNPVNFEIYQNVGHGFDDDGLPQSADARKRSIEFLKKHLHMN